MFAALATGIGSRPLPSGGMRGIDRRRHVPGRIRSKPRIVIPRRHPGPRGKSEAPIEPESQAGAVKAAASYLSAAARAKRGPSGAGFPGASLPRVRR